VVVFAFAFALAACGGGGASAPGPAAEGGAAGEAKCQSDKICRPPAPPVCAPGAQPSDWGELRDGREVRVHGIVKTGTKACTEMACGGLCCNTCTAPMVVEIGADMKASIALDLMCKGDDSGVCCPVAPGSTVTVAGVFHSNPNRLSNVQVCR
jgi:hypothetical protein